MTRRTRKPRVHHPEHGWGRVEAVSALNDQVSLYFVGGGTAWFTLGTEWSVEGAGRIAEMFIEDAKRPRIANMLRERKQRDPADLDTPTEDLEAEERKLDAEIDAAYWRFSRCARAQPSAVTHATQYRRRRAVRAELMHRRRS